MVHVLPSEGVPVIVLPSAHIVAVVVCHVDVVVVLVTHLVLVVLEGLEAAEAVELGLRGLLVGLDLDVLVRGHYVDGHVLVVVARVPLALRRLLLPLEMGLDHGREGSLLAVARVNQVVRMRLMSRSLILNERALLAVDEVVVVLTLEGRILLSGL